MVFSSIIVFVFGTIFGAFVIYYVAGFYPEKLPKNNLKDSSFFGATIKSDIVEAKKDLKLYQDGKEIGILYKGARLKKTLHVDKIDHYDLNLIFEPFSYKNVKEIIAEDKDIKDFSVTDIIYMGDG